MEKGSLKKIKRTYYVFPSDIWRFILKQPEMDIVTLSRTMMMSHYFKDIVESLNVFFLEQAESQRIMQKIKGLGEILTKAALCKNVKAMLHIGWLGFYTKNFNLCIWFKKAYEYGNSLIGAVIYQNMNPLDDPEFSKIIIEKANRSKDPFVRAWCYDVANPCNYDKAIEWYEKCNKDDEYAQLAFAYLLQDIDRERSVKLLTKVSEEYGNGIARNRLKRIAKVNEFFMFFVVQ